MQIDWWTLALQAINFLILAWLLQRLLYRPVRAVIARRQEAAEEAFAKAAEAKKEAAEAKRRFEALRAELADQRQRTLKEIHEEMESERRHVLEAARREAAELTDAARSKLEAEREVALADLREHTAELAATLARRLLEQVECGSLPDSFLHRVESYLGDLPEDQLTSLREELAGDGAALVVTTAQPLNSRQQQRWRKRLRDRLGDTTAIDFAADPSLIAGTDLHFPHAVLHFDLADSIDAAKRRIAGNDHAA